MQVCLCCENLHVHRPLLARCLVVDKLIGIFGLRRLGPLFPATINPAGSPHGPSLEEMWSISPGLCSHSPDSFPIYPTPQPLNLPHKMEWMEEEASVAASVSYTARHMSQSFGLGLKIHALITLGHAKSNAEAHHTKRCVARCGLKLHTS